MKLKEGEAYFRTSNSIPFDNSSKKYFELTRLHAEVERLRKIIKYTVDGFDDGSLYSGNPVGDILEGNLRTALEEKPR